MSECIVGHCQREAVSYERCVEHCRPLSALANEDTKQPAPLPTRRGLLDKLKKVEVTRSFPALEKPTKERLLIRITRRCTVGRLPVSGIDVIGAIDDVFDATELEQSGILAGGGTSTAEAFAAQLIRSRKGELVHLSDLARLQPKRPRPGMVTAAGASGPPRQGG